MHMVVMPHSMTAMVANLGRGQAHAGLQVRHLGIVREKVEGNVFGGKVLQKLYIFVTEYGKIRW